MSKTLCLLALSCFVGIFVFQKTVIAQSAQPPALQEALALAQEAGISSLWPMIERVRVVPLTDTSPPLAQYHPKQDPQTESIIGEIRLGTNYHRYKKEYLVLSSTVNRLDRPDFNQYMTVLTLLSLSNENAHFIQHLNGSLDDFYHYLEADHARGMCTLYALQQHVSDIKMLESALIIENYFLGIGSPKGINAVHLALKKMELGNLFEEFRHAYRSRDMFSLKDSLDHIFHQRLKYNIASLSKCRGTRMTLLEKDVFKRAIQPAENVFPKIISSPNTTTQYNH